MKHYSEYTLDLYVRNSEQIAHERAAIESHLMQCAGCSTIVDDLKAFYTLAENNIKLLSVSNETEDALVVQPQYIRTRPLTQIQMPNSLPQRVWYFARKRPIVSGVSGVAILMFCIFGIHTYQSSSDDNPAYYRFNETTNTLEILNAADQVLWNTPIRDAKTLNQWTGKHSLEAVTLFDIDGDGKNEVLTILPVGSELDKMQILKVFNGKKRLLFKQAAFNDEYINFKDTEYVKTFYACGMTALKVQHQPNIFVTSNNGRSPSIVVRLDQYGNIIGRYWHFGQITGVRSLDVDNDGDEELVLIGMNDVPFPDITFSIVVVLDPEKIIGDTESSATPGFGFPKAMCERYYIQIPRSDVDSALSSQAVANRLEKDKNAVSVLVTSEQAKDYNFEYIFSHSMNILAVKGDDPGARYYEKMKAEGKVISTYGNAYFDQLKKGVRYWNGKQWLAEPTQVFPENNNPHKYVINTETNTIEVFNAENTKLWNLILVNNFHTLHGNKDEYFNEYVRINDLDGDGVNEVVTTLCTEHNQRDNASVIQVFNYDGTLRYRKELGKQITYGSAQHPNAFTTKGLIVRDFDRDGKSEIYVGLTHRNSPYSLVKLDYQGNETGRYWTYGHAFGIDTLLIQGKTYMALKGIDDTQEERKALLTILNPNEIHGEKRGTLFKEYNFSSSNAEEYVVNFPRTELEVALGVPKPRVTQIVYQNSEGFAVCVGIPYKEQIFGIADVHFSSTLAVKNILFIDGAKTMHELLRKQGKITAEWNESYSETLKKQIRYWDGKTWNNFLKKRKSFAIK